MTGIIFMILGALLFITGIVTYLTGTKSEKQIKQLSSQVAAIQNSTITNMVALDAEEQEGRSKEEILKDLDKLKALAIADGVLTQNERIIIQQSCEAVNVDASSYIAQIEKELSDSDIEPETESIDPRIKNGYEFEQFIVKKFNMNYFKIIRWSSDKYVDGRYDETNQQPDVQLSITVKGETKELVVECKWRKDFFKGGIEFASQEQLARYKQYEKEKGLPVFLAVGVGGKGMAPDHLFLIPLSEIKSNFIGKGLLEKYRMGLDHTFFFNLQEMSLTSYKPNI